ncbi:PREDICTED: F-box/kelch-repeat protein At3g13680-like [Brassica oleracea var. oleracea]|nr:PREDICTED: F-box/kelch-repeat protein At3g13680-like [Brassica oleracea var. oleracea]
MKTIMDLPEVLLTEEILARVPLNSIKSVRSTSKKWNSLSKKMIIGKAAERKQQFITEGFVIKDQRVCFMKFNLQGIRIYQNSVHPCSSNEQVSILDQIDISKVIHCDGLLLCVAKDELLVWNPYLGQTRWIQHRTKFEGFESLSLGYDKKNRNHKILRFCFVPLPGISNSIVGFEIYDFSSNSWKVLDVTPPEWGIRHCRHNSVSLKGNAYFSAVERRHVPPSRNVEEDFLVCFDFTTECFGPRLPLPFDTGDCFGILVSLSCVRDEQLAVLFQRWETHERIDICITTKIGPNSVSWTKLMVGVPGFMLDLYGGSFFIDEENKLAVVFDLDMRSRFQTAHIIATDYGYLKSVDIRVSPADCPLVYSSYAPSLVQLQ